MKTITPLLTHIAKSILGDNWQEIITNFSQYFIYVVAALTFLGRSINEIVQDKATETTMVRLLAAVWVVNALINLKQSIHYRREYHKTKEALFNEAGRSGRYEQAARVLALTIEEVDPKVLANLGITIEEVEEIDGNNHN